MGINKKTHWYHSLNGLVVGLGLLFPITYSIIAFALPEESRSDLLSIDVRAAIVAVIAGLYGIFVYPGFHKKEQKTAIIIGYSLILTATAIQIIVSGGVESPYLILWGILVIASGIVGWQMITLAAVSTNIYWILVSMGIIELDLASDRLILFITFTQLPIVVALLIAMLTHSEVSEESISDLSDNLTIEQNKTGIVLQAIDDAVFVINRNGNIEYMNPASELLTGWSREQAVGLKHTSVINLRLQESPDHVDNPIESVFKDAKHSNSKGFNLLTRNQREVGVSISASPLQPGTTSDGIVVVFRDITKEKAEEKRRQDFISTASHEMRTPIAQIKGYLELLLNPQVIQLDEKARNFVEKSHKSTEHLGELFRDLLEVSKSDSGAKSDHPEAVDINKLMEEVIENHQLQARPKGLELSVEFIKNHNVEPDIFVYMDRQNLREVLDNLIGNSVKYTKEGFVKVTIAHNETFVQIDISDSGIGIANEDMNHLFERFYRADSSDTREIGGTGLGLYLVKQIVEHNNGKIWVDSELGKGSIFHVQLPMLDNQKAQVLVKRKELDEAAG